LALPKFRYDTDLGLRNGLTALDMADAVGDQADFSGIGGTHKLFIEQVYHQAFVDVDESGTEAASASAVAMARKGALQAEQDIRVNRPFLFRIRAIDTSAILSLTTSSIHCPSRRARHPQVSTAGPPTKPHLATGTPQLTGSQSHSVPRRYPSYQMCPRSLPHLALPSYAIHCEGQIDLAGESCS
jgi:hypothetical protein